MKFIAISLFIMSLMNQASAQMFKHMPAQNRCLPFSASWTPGFNSDIVGYWKMNGVVGAIGDAAVIPATIGTNGAMAGTTGNYVTSTVESQAISLSGSSTNYLSFGALPAYADLSSMTLMAWVKITAASPGALFYKSDNNGSAGWFFYTGGNSFNFKAVRSGTNFEYFTDERLPEVEGQWAQVVLTWNGVLNRSGVHVYVNGVEWGIDADGYSQDGSGTRDSDAAEPLYFGYDGGGVPAGYKGSIDQSAVWNRVLSPAEVAHLYRNQKCN